MTNLVKATLYRMVKSTGVRIAYMLTIFAAIGYYVLAHMVAEGTFTRTNAGSVTALGDAMIIWLFGSLLTGIIICSDFENKTIHGAIAYGRRKILFNYVIVYAIVIVTLLLPYTLGSIFCMIGKVNMTGAQATDISVYMDNIFRSTETYSLGKVILSYFTMAVVYVGQISICIPIAIKFKKPVVVTAVGFFIGMITALLAALAEKVDIFDRMYKVTPYAYNLSKVNAVAPYGTLILAIIVSVIFTVIMGLVSYLLFYKAEIK